MSVLHLWLGLLSSIVLFLVCLSGSIYAFKQQIEDFVNREHVYIEPTAIEPIAIDSVISSFEKKFTKATSITVFDKKNKSLLVSSFSRNSQGITAYYNPYSGVLLGTKNTSSISFFDFILDLHRFLLIGDIGKFINGVAVLIFIFMLFSGFILWLPKKLKQLKKGLIIKWKARFYRLNYDLHKVAGFYSILLLLFISITGLYVSFHWVKNTIIVGLGGHSIIISDNNNALKNDLSSSFNMLLGELSEEKEVEKEQSSSLQDLVLKSKSILPYKGTIKLQLASEQENSFQLTKMNSQNILHFYVPDKIEFSIGGKARNILKFNTLPLHEQFKAISKPLHTGEIMGLPSIILYFIVSLIGCLLPITGFIIWWKKVS